MGGLRRLGLPGRTVRMRYTLLYAAVFLASGIGLLVLTNLLSGGVSMTEPAPGQAIPTRPSAAQERIAQLEAQLADVEAAQSHQLLVNSVIALLVMVGVSVLLGNAVAGRVLRPLRTITSATRRISAENLHERLAVPGPADEVTELADTIDELLERLEVSFAAQRRFVANASHELRTPLATMRASLDVAVAKTRPAPQTLALATRLRTELDRVDELLEGLLALARAQHGALGERVAVPLAELVSDALDARAADIAALGLSVETGVQDGAWTHGSRPLLARVADNLIDNAVAHNQEGGWVRVTTATGGGWARLVVETGGPVLDPDQVTRLAQPFRRLAADRTGSEAGRGLGLSIVAAVVDGHGGRLELAARPEGGLLAAVSLPAASARQGALG
jgi:signal transduction histidine kinase